MSPRYGVISDDFTGGLLIASYFEEAGLECPVFFDPEDAAAAAPLSAPIVVIASRTRLIPVDDARTELTRALDALDALGCATVAYKACATFDSTEEGNIGLAADMLADRYGDLPVLLSAGFPEFRCTVAMGHMFYQSTLVNESAKRFDPVTPMPDPNMVRFLSQQTRAPLGHVSHLDLVQGEAVARAALQAEAAKGHRQVLLDCADDGDVTVSMQLARGTRAIVASDPLCIAVGLDRAAGLTGTAPAPRHADGPVAVLIGSVGPVAEDQTAAFAAEHPVLRIDLISPTPVPQQITEACAWAADHIGHRPFAITTLADADGVKAAQAAFGQLGAARRAEALLSGIAAHLHDAGVRRFIVSGGETSGAVVGALGIRRVRPFARGPLGGGFCVSDGIDPVSFFLKSGKLGTSDVLLRALDEMKG
ncbi:four-carbon acid sugar kinase family protein [Pseudooceanicola onchidii]|uniref:four-carbon acid sugar kinase family protein n=1 Tax=Pseudooceanicola onchidii TaxID=2562279 RepID=UPI0010AA2EC5|nr:four-carbon acid sugar kinase family protein [Pseudooceanicola onchidii]